LLKTLVEAKPTLFFGVPRVYEKIREKMMEVAKSNSGNTGKHTIGFGSFPFLIKVLSGLK
jgi:long-subunit acyl-CoA synthetase (AMP-forming)